MNDENDVELLAEKARQMTVSQLDLPFSSSGLKTSALCFLRLGGLATPHTALSSHRAIIETCKHAIRFYLFFTYILIRERSKL